MTELAAKQRRLKDIIKNLPSAAVAFSGGVDSTFLLSVASEILGPKVAAVTGRSLSFPERELTAAKAFAAEMGVRHYLVDSEELDLPGFGQNPPNRCYLCKKELFGKIIALARDNNLAAVMEASNADDEGDYRPGLIAIRELEILSPLREARLTKAEIRTLSRERGLATWDKPSFACLASRFPYGESITPERLSVLDRAEQFLLDLGLKQVRVRLHEKTTLARIETDDEGLGLIFKGQNRHITYEFLKNLGFTYVAVDLLGYRTGSMNATLPGESAPLGESRTKKG
ncbi:MAG: ATP-dependent sacrificial sulfur transferase LarE [Deltaproteobacteria bacterium]|jgi:uncharacterized protein|nr:ATP-dependent sacrificial sulfur transferase LarE [Deltaproteobacteria bacterium]